MKISKFLDQINLCTVKQEMEISEKYWFHTRLQLKNLNIQVVHNIKVLATNYMEHSNKKKGDARMQVLRQVWSFGSSVIEIVHTWLLQPCEYFYCKSVFTRVLALQQRQCHCHGVVSLGHQFTGCLRGDNTTPQLTLQIRLSVCW